MRLREISLGILSSAWTNQRPPLRRTSPLVTRPGWKIGADGLWSLRNRGQFVIHTSCIHISTKPFCDGICDTHARQISINSSPGVFYLFIYLFISVCRNYLGVTREHVPLSTVLSPPGTRRKREPRTSTSSGIHGGLRSEDFPLHTSRWARECHGCPTWCGRRRRSGF